MRFVSIVFVVRFVFLILLYPRAILTIFIVDDSVCIHFKTVAKDISVKGRSCTADGCRGQFHLVSRLVLFHDVASLPMTQTYSDTLLHNQLEYFQFLFNISHHQQRINAATNTRAFETGMSLVDHAKEKFELLFNHVCCIIAFEFTQHDNGPFSGTDTLNQFHRFRWANRLKRTLDNLWIWDSSSPVWG